MFEVDLGKANELDTSFIFLETLPQPAPCVTGPARTPANLLPSTDQRQQMWPITTFAMGTSSCPFQSEETARMDFFNS